MVCLGCGTHIACGAGAFMYLLYDDVIFCNEMHWRLSRA